MTAVEFAFTQASTKLVISPIDHFAGARLTRRTWQAELRDRSDAANDGPAQLCPHHSGHQTVEAAKACGTAMWKKLSA